MGSFALPGIVRNLRAIPCDDNDHRSVAPRRPPTRAEQAAHGITNAPPSEVGPRAEPGGARRPPSSTRIARPGRYCQRQRGEPLLTARAWACQINGGRPTSYHRAGASLRAARARGRDPPVPRLRPRARPIVGASSTRLALARGLALNGAPSPPKRACSWPAFVCSGPVPVTPLGCSLTGFPPWRGLYTTGAPGCGPFRFPWHASSTRGPRACFCAATRCGDWSRASPCPRSRSVAWPHPRLTFHRDVTTPRRRTGHILCTSSR